MIDQNSVWVHMNLLPPKTIARYLLFCLLSFFLHTFEYRDNQFFPSTCLLDFSRMLRLIDLYLYEMVYVGLRIFKVTGKKIWVI